MVVALQFLPQMCQQANLDLNLDCVGLPIHTFSMVCYLHYYTNLVLKIAYIMEGKSSHMLQTHSLLHIYTPPKKASILSYC